MTLCPCCGQSIQKPYSFDHLKGVLSVDDRLIRLTPMEADIFAVCLESLNRPVKTDTLVRKVYGLSEPGGPQESLAVMAYHLRRKLRGTPFSMSGERGNRRLSRGYTLSLTS